MPRIIIKPDRDGDLYVEWSSVVDAPLFAGGRDAMLKHLWAEWSRDPQYVMSTDPERPENRLHRCDKTGTSALWPPGQVAAYSWDEEDGGGVVYLGSERPAWSDSDTQDGWVPRERLGQLVRRLIADRDADVSDLLDPLDDD